ncbi:nucleotide exchange factor GrpE [Phocicoccus pinnipedialis]|uniref:Protein GrpE n=1 Tax=Phocicoccus pinnipedialis TaxID=110845 RepID=A0A6V7RFZ2_9BACL|nr:nucleotide exchange factor GrpE [Jeotgalicoccus pinnipedialis]MBP1939254.1 molecular chaperone GrpE [Jeotgalicoccus pinnipedialis]CAD2076129.1 Protein GrpE [Jeotgalicoccus pinnipedialis]
MKKEDVNEEITKTGNEEENTEPVLDEGASSNEETVEITTEPEVDEESSELNTLKSKLEEEENKYLKLYAEFENYKRRTREEAERNNKYKNQSFAEDLLSVIDNLERALQISGNSEEFESLHKGVEIVYNDFINKLNSNGITLIDAQDKDFDPNFHQAVMTEAVEGVSSGVVIEVFQTGYMLKERVLRPAMVKVSE